MGIDMSRKIPIPLTLDKNREIIMSTWYKKSVIDNYHSQYQQTSTISHKILSVAGEELAICLNKHDITGLKILEIFAGNCIASDIINNKIINLTNSLMRTDITDYSNNKLTNFNRLNTVDAVRIFGPAANVLLMISPPPTDEKGIATMDVSINLGYADYFACKDFINFESCERRLIVIIGELGASDGSAGIYRYLLEHKRLNLIHRKLLTNATDMFGGKLEKELFVFLVK